MGAIKLSELCKELEENCKKETHHNTTDLITDVEREYDLVKELLSLEINSI